MTEKRRTFIIISVARQAPNACRAFFYTWKTGRRAAEGETEELFFRDTLCIIGCIQKREMEEM